MSQSIPKVARSDVERVTKRQFPADVVDRVLLLLETYGSEEWHRERDRVHLACLKLASGDLKSLEHQIAVARLDYRDVVGAAEYPEMFKLGFVGMKQLKETNPSALQESQQRDWEQYESWLNAT
jgi:hypothetical protein